MNTPEKIEAAGKKKEEGNALFKAGKYARASQRYEKVSSSILNEVESQHQTWGVVGIDPWTSLSLVDEIRLSLSDVFLLMIVDHIF